MMGRSHAMCGLTAGVLAAGALGHAPLPVRLLIIPVCGGAALLPDLDHPRGTAARSLGPVTMLLAHMINELAVQLYHATRAPGDPKVRRDGHRLITHTVPGCAAFGIPGVAWHLVGGDLAGSVIPDPWWAARIPGILTALGLGVTLGLLARTDPRIGTLFTVGGTVASWWVVVEYPGWWWCWPAVVVLGCLVHVLGDGCTVAGVPVCFPFTVETERGPMRWYMVRVPGAFDTGGAFEKEALSWILGGSLIASVGLTTGILPAVLGGLWAVTSG